MMGCNLSTLISLLRESRYSSPNLHDISPYSTPNFQQILPLHVLKSLNALEKHIVLLYIRYCVLCAHSIRILLLNPSTLANIFFFYKVLGYDKIVIDTVNKGYFSLHNKYIPSNPSISYIIIFYVCLCVFFLPNCIMSIKQPKKITTPKIHNSTTSNIHFLVYIATILQKPIFV